MAHVTEDIITLAVTLLLASQHNLPDLCYQEIWITRVQSTLYLVVFCLSLLLVYILHVLILCTMLCDER